jgi:hypothetical protein
MSSSLHRTPSGGPSGHEDPHSGGPHSNGWHPPAWETYFCHTCRDFTPVQQLPDGSVTCTRCAGGICELIESEEQWNELGAFHRHRRPTSSSIFGPSGSGLFSNLNQRGRNTSSASGSGSFGSNPSPNQNHVIGDPQQQPQQRSLHAHPLPANYPGSQAPPNDGNATGVSSTTMVPPASRVRSTTHQSSIPGVRTTTTTVEDAHGTPTASSTTYSVDLGELLQPLLMFGAALANAATQGGTSGSGAQATTESRSGSGGVSPAPASSASQPRTADSAGSQAGTATTMEPSTSTSFQGDALGEQFKWLAAIVARAGWRHFQRLVATLNGETRSTPKAVIDALPRRPHHTPQGGEAPQGDHPGLDNDNCAICQDELVEGVTELVLPCGHCFHEDCIIPWLERSRSCPNCRKPVC